MAEITAQMVKELREKTSAGMMDCKKALSATNGDFDAAVNWLREKGLSAAAKKAGRIAAEGLVDIAQDGDVVGMVEVNCETDFVAKNPDFQGLAKDLAAAVVKTDPADVAAFQDKPLQGKTVKDVVTEKISKIGENLSVRRFVRLSGSGPFGNYIHGAGNMGVVVELETLDKAKAKSETAKVLAKDLAMHVAAQNPLFLRREDADQKTLDNERHVYREKAKADGKPEKILEKIVEGQIQKFLAESCLLEQAFVKDPDITVSKLLDKVGKELGTTITVKSMHRFKVGEGIEKKADDFAAEVAKMSGVKA